MTDEQFNHLKRRIELADLKHGPADDDSKALGALHREVWELTEALQHREAWEVREEFLDATIVPLRRWLAMEGEV